MPEDLVKIYMAQLINSLEFMQSKNVIHRDLKPLNIMLDENFNLKLIDFGDAKVVEEKEKLDQSTNKSVVDQPSTPEEDSLDQEGYSDGRLTDEEGSDQTSDDEDGNGPALERTETFVGTQNYLSPEMITGKPQGFELDVWVSGLIMFKMLTGKPAFKGLRPEIIQQDILARNINWPKTNINEIMSKDAQDIINKLIQLEPSKRIKLPELKKHRFFHDIDFDEVSKPNYKEAVGLVTIIRDQFIES